MRQQKADGENGNSGGRMENTVSKGNRQETNMAIHFLKPEALYLSRSIGRRSGALSRGDSDSSSRHIPNIVDEQGQQQQPHSQQ